MWVAAQYLFICDIVLNFDIVILVIQNIFLPVCIYVFKIIIDEIYSCIKE